MEARAICSTNGVLRTASRAPTHGARLRRSTELIKPDERRQASCDCIIASSIGTRDAWIGLTSSRKADGRHAKVSQPRRSIRGWSGSRTLAAHKVMR
eukprot:1185132-Prorocentrum_minimum.AAC.3